MKIIYLIILVSLVYGYTNVCNTCLASVEFIGYTVNHYNKTIHDISEATKDLCDDIGGKPVAMECDFIVDNIEKIVDWIQNGTTPQKICNMLGLC
jgi:hypothetical protein